VTQALLNVVLVRPEIPQNTGSIARLTAGVRLRLHLVGPLGFSLEDRYLRRAGLDYWPLVDLRTYERVEDFFGAHPNGPFKLFSARASQNYIEAQFAPGDFLLFGSETRGLGRTILGSGIGPAYRIPIFEPAVRSLNLSNAVSIVVYEALRRLGRLDQP
jgi:tRNA (cytidine/uridine-2'-O-)-methyltransferase